MDCREAKRRMHEYLDGELDEREAGKLACHLRQCEPCSRHLGALEKTDAIIGSLRRLSCPEEVAERVLALMPSPRRSTAFIRLIRRHPGASAAILVFGLLVAGVAALWHPDDTLTVKTNDLDRLIVHGRQVIVPEGTTVNGDLIVENGDLQVDGEVRGNVIIFDGSVSASADHISGKVKQINQAFDRLVYRVENFVSHVSFSP